MKEGDAFRLLGLSPGASQAEVRAAFRRRVMERHPDTASDETVGPDVQALVDAYRLLLGSEARSEYRTGPRFGEGSGSGRRIEVDHRPGSGAARSTGRARPCQACSGSGVRNRDSSCPDCRGAGQVTVLDVHRVRVSRCGSCQGRGWLRTLEICEVCEGSAR